MGPSDMANIDVQHEYHHDRENLKRIARHVSHDRLHGQLFGGAECDLPCLLQLQCLCLFRSRRLSSTALRFLPVVSMSLQYGGFARRTCLPATAFELVKPGGSGILVTFFGLGGTPLLRSMTHLGGGGTILFDIFEVQQASSYHSRKRWLQVQCE